ncbi:Wzy polymerase domain-containing protein [Pontibacter sp. JAM-7]|uniref:PglL family O-oligosaccharyltransferase n=1 Tax=Pontibacter sp. JAM-7 TaxID=3366581 RepID=UPI003AF73E78
MKLGLKLEKDPSLKAPQKLFFALISLLFLIAPFYYQPNLGGEGLYLPFNSTIWLVASWVIASGCFILIRSGSILLPRHWLALAMLPIGALVSGFITDNTNPTEWTTRILVLIGSYCLLISLYQFRLTPRQIERSLYILLITGLISGCYGLVQLVPRIELAPYMPLSGNKTPFGIFQQINLQASLMATTLVLLFYLISRPTISGMHWVVKIALCLTGFISCFIIAYSGSRVGLLGATAGLLVLCLGRWRLLFNHKYVLAAVIACCIGGGALGSSGLTKTFNKFDQAIGGMDSDVRWKVYRISLDLFLEKPLVGHGVGSFQKVFQDKRAEYQADGKLSLGTQPRFTHPHNELMLWLVEAGLISLAGIVIAAVATFYQLYKTGWQRGTGYAALLIPLTLHSQVELPFYISNTHWVLLLYLLFVVHQQRSQRHTTDGMSLAAQKTVPALMLVSTVLINVFLIHSLYAYSGMIAYLRDNKRPLEYLESALLNPYYRNYAVYLTLKQQMYKGFDQNDPQPALKYIAWADRHLTMSPQVPVYMDLAVAYGALGRVEQRDRVMQEAMAIYDSNKSLQGLRQRFDRPKPDATAAEADLSQPPASQP